MHPRLGLIASVQRLVGMHKAAQYSIINSVFINVGVMSQGVQREGRPQKKRKYTTIIITALLLCKRTPPGRSSRIVRGSGQLTIDVFRTTMY